MDEIVIISAKAITRIINEAWDGVENSKCGSILKTQEDKSIVINQLPFHAFLAVLSAVLPKNISSDINLKEPPEPWKG